MSDFIIENGVLAEYRGSDSEVKIPEGITKISSLAFQECHKLIKVSIPEGVTKIDSYAFARCRNLQTIEFPTTLEEISSCAFYYCSSLQEVKLFEKVKEIGNQAFANCSSLHTVKLCDGIKKIGEEAFYYCSLLKEIHLSDSVTMIGERAFMHTALESIVLSKKMKTISCAVFRNTKLKRVVIPGNIKSIGEFAFCECPLEEVVFEEGVQTLKNRSFVGTALKEIYFPESVKVIGRTVFEKCKDLKEIHFPYRMADVSNDIFKDTNLDEQSIVDGWLLHAENTQQITIAEEVKGVATGAMEGCNELKELHIVGHNLFMDSLFLGFKKDLKVLQHFDLLVAPEYKLEEIPEQLRVYAAAGLMWYCEKKQTVTTEHTAMKVMMENTDSTYWMRVFQTYPSVFKYALQEKILPLSFVETLMTQFTKNGNKEGLLELLNYKNSVSDVEQEFEDVFALEEELEVSKDIYMTKKEASKLWSLKKLPDDTWRIGSYKGKEPEMMIPSYVDDLPVTVIGKSPAASNFIQKVEIPDTVTTIEGSAFKDFVDLKELKIGKEVVFLGANAFMGCSSLTEVELPEKVKMIPHWLFAGCTKLQTLRVLGKETDVEGEANFLRNNRKATLYVHRENQKIMNYLSGSSRKIEFIN